MGDQPNGCIISGPQETKLQPYVKDLVEALGEAIQYKELAQYKESSGNLEAYLHQWKSWIQQPLYPNLLLHKPLEVTPDNGIERAELKMMTDGMPGFIYQYYQGWVRINQPIIITLPPTEKAQGNKLVIRCLLDAAHHFLAPKKITLLYDQSDLPLTLAPTDQPEKEGSQIYQTNLPSNNHQVILRLELSPQEGASLAFDEIQIK